MEHGIWTRIQNLGNLAASSRGPSPACPSPFLYLPWLVATATFQEAGNTAPCTHGRTSVEEKGCPPSLSASTNSRRVDTGSFRLGCSRTCLGHGMTATQPVLMIVSDLLLITQQDQGLVEQETSPGFQNLACVHMAKSRTVGYNYTILVILHEWSYGYSEPRRWLSQLKPFPVSMGIQVQILRTSIRARCTAQVSHGLGLSQVDEQRKENFRSSQEISMQQRRKQ